MRKLEFLFVILFTIFSLTSCGTYAQVYEESYERPTVTYSAIVTNGTPVYYNGVISYYVYGGMYYYPYTYRNVRYFMPYRYCQPHGFVYRPEPQHRPINHLGHRYEMHYNGFHGNYIPQPSRRPRNKYRSDIKPNRPNRDRVQPNKGNRGGGRR